MKKVKNRKTIQYAMKKKYIHKYMFNLFLSLFRTYHTFIIDYNFKLDELLCLVFDMLLLFSFRNQI